MNYYGDKISKNMVMTPEGYLVCENVPIGRTGYMEYLGRELPSAFNEPTGELFRVYRSPEELFSEATIASFEGKPVTNTHPVANLDVNTVPMIERGHVQNIRREGDFLMADLHVKDAGLISEIQNELKREVSSGYDCSWHKIGEGVYEQREIIGNHVAVVPNGRAGPKVAIMDAALNEKPKTGGKKTMKITQKMLAAIGFKHFAQDADPEDIAKAMDAMKEDEAEKKDPAKDAEPDPEKKEPAKDAEPEQGSQLIDMMNKLLDRIEKLESREEAQQGETADAVMDALEKDMDKEVKDEDPDPDKKEDPEKKETKDTDPDPEKKGAADAGLKKWVQDMKPIIMAIPDEKVRLETAKKFASSVQDARSFRSANGYGSILTAVDKNKRSAMDGYNAQKQSVAEQAEVACNAWAAAGEKMKGGK